MLVLVAGPSGAGKDSLLNAARAALLDEPRIAFARRVITRPIDPGGEDHEPISAAGFAAQAFALSWSAHGLSYGLTAAALAAAPVVVANVSRGVIADAARLYDSRVIEVTAPASVLAARLASRGRESAVEISRRLDRGVAMPAGISPAGISKETVVNDGALTEAAARFVGILRRWIEEAD